MKINEIFLKENKFITDDDEIRRYCELYGIENFNIDHEGKVEVYQSVTNTLTPEFLINGEFPIQFSIIHGNFGILGSADAKLKSFRGAPWKVDRMLSMQQHEISSFDGLDKCSVTDSVILMNNNITSLIGIEKRFSHIGSALFIDWAKITKGGLGLTQILGLTNLLVMRNELPKPFKIIQKYLGRPSKLFDCQAELLDAGFDDFAEL